MQSSFRYVPIFLAIILYVSIGVAPPQVVAEDARASSIIVYPFRAVSQALTNLHGQGS